MIMKAFAIDLNEFKTTFVVVFKLPLDLFLSRFLLDKNSLFPLVGENKLFNVHFVFNYKL